MAQNSLSQQLSVFLSPPPSFTQLSKRENEIRFVYLLNYRLSSSSSSSSSSSFLDNNRPPIVCSTARISTWVSFDEPFTFPVVYTTELLNEAESATDIYRVCHGFRLMKRDDYFWVIFNPFWNEGHYLRQLGSSENWLEPKTLPPLQILTKLSLSKSLLSTVHRIRGLRSKMTPVLLHIVCLSVGISCQFNT